MPKNDLCRQILVKKYFIGKSASNKNKIDW